PNPEQLERLRQRVSSWVAELGLAAATRASDLGLVLSVETRSSSEVTSEERQALDRIDAEIGPLTASRGLVAPEVRLSRADRREPRFDVGKMTEILDGRHIRIRTRMRQILSRPQFDYLDDPNRDRYRRQVLEWTQLLADEGLGSLAYPEPHGAGDMAGFISAFRMLAHHDLSLLTKFGVQFGLFGGAIAKLGTDRHHNAYLEDVGRMRMPGCFAMTETAHGSNVRDLETTATYDPPTDELIIDTPRDFARKDYIGNAARDGQMAVTFARLIVGEIDHGVHAILVPLRDDSGTIVPGVTITDIGSKGGLNGVDNGRITFRGVRVPRLNLLDRYATIDETGSYQSEIPDPDRRFFTTIGTLVGGRISVGAAANSVTTSALAIAIRYAHRRRQFGDNPESETLLIDYPLHQQRLIPRLAATYAFHFAFDELVNDYAREEDVDQREIEARAAGLKALASWHALETIQTAREACGGQGYLNINRLTHMYEDADVFTTFEGDNIVLLQLVAKSLLTDFRQQFESMNTIGMLRYLAKRAQDRVAETTPITFSTTDPERLIAADWQVDLLRRRRQHLVESLALRIKKLTEAGAAPYDAFIVTQTHAIAAATSHGEFLVLEAFVGRVKSLSPSREKTTLDRLRALHGLTTIRSNLGWLQEHNLISAASASAVVELQERVTADVAADSLGLVDAFAIPDRVLSAPIAIYETEQEYA
ncbi:MAG TPA: acyl-CoA dehydrogenase, partial [Acidimicrobiia bacterium]|nr:acyl-CoA dehydrogenase [Acidimicrobiia bacterium]